MATDDVNATGEADDAGGGGARTAGLESMRGRIVNALSWAATVFGFVAYVPSVIASLIVGYGWLAVVDTVIYAWVVAVRALRLRSATRAKHLVAMLAVVGAALLVALGPFGYGPMWLVGATVAAGTLLGRRAAVVALAAHVVAVAAATVALVAVHPSWWIDRGDNVVSAWLAFSGSSLFLSAALSFPVARLLQGLEAAAERRAKLERELRRARTLEAMGTVAGSIAHEFSNLLQPILALSATALVTTKLDEQTSSDLREILHAAERARDLVRQMLTLTRKADAPKRLASLSQAVREASVLLKASVGASVAVEIVDDVTAAGRDEGDDVVLLGPSDVQQILLNLVINAAYAVKQKGHGTVRVRVGPWRGEPPATAADAGRGFVRLDVEDDGAGMDAATLERVFEPFFTTKPAGEGTGLGLATVHGIVRALGGSIGVTSEPGCGTTFSIAVPRAPIAATSETAGDGAGEGAGQPPSAPVEKAV